jgi:hypothetical protein
MQAKTVARQTRNRNLVIPARASKSTFLCGLCALCGEFFLRGRRRRWALVLQCGTAATKSRFFAPLRSAQNDISTFFASREEVAR